ncbi:MAG: C39 family peptidase [Patescibacteria group bacterium]
MRSAIFTTALLLPLLAGCTSTATPSGYEPRMEQLNSESESSASSLASAGIHNPPSSIALPRPQDSSKTPLPSTFAIEVPFTPQAPHANWDDPYQESCEEASLLMVHWYLQGEKRAVVPADEADRDLLALIRWETNKGYGEDVTLTQLGEVAKQYYDYTPVIEETVTVERIKELLVAGYPVIVPIAGRDLGNPYFSGEGPWYHMLVIVGYDRNEFITNEPGTRRGEGYEYAYDVLIAAIHDWTGVKEEIRTGAKRMMILKR